MSTITKFTERERVTINVAKTAGIFSVIAAHVVTLIKTDLLSNIVSSAWSIFGKVGVILFFIIGGFLYSRKDGDGRFFFGKKAFRIFIPWLFCSLLTYLISSINSHSLSWLAFFKWILGSDTWYYYAAIYTLFLFIFKWFYNNEVVLYSLIGVQIIVIVLKGVGFSTTLPFDFFTDYLNPLHWVGYFSAGILLRKNRFDILFREKSAVFLLSVMVSVISFLILFKYEIYTYFNIITSIFCVSSFVMILSIAYWFSQFKLSKHVGKVGEYSFCIYLLHMQIVQCVISKIPDGIVKIILSPLIGLFVMLVLISFGLWFCKKIPFGDKLKMLVGL